MASLTIQGLAGLSPVRIVLFLAHRASSRSGSLPWPGDCRWICLLGYWPVMPFAGLEMGVLAWAFEVIRRRELDYENLVIDRDRVS